MHEYYAKNAAKLHKTLDKFMRLVENELTSVSGQSYDVLLAEIWQVYEKDMLARFPYIGGDEVSGTNNLTQAYMLVAMGEVMKKYGANLEEIGEIMISAYERRTLKMPKIARKFMGRMFQSPKLLNKMFLKKDRKNAANALKNPGSFETKTQIPPEAGYDFSYHNLVCPLADFARKYGYEKYMPYLCNLDYVMFGILGAPLFREHTCFEDGDCCDFKLKADAEPLPYRPPVFLQDNKYK